MEHFYKTIDGCFTWPVFYSELAKELAAKGKPTRGVELGTMNGQSLAYLGVELINAGAQCVVDGVDIANGNGIARTNLKPVRGKTIGELICGISWTTAKLYADRSLDFVFIDAEHDYNSVRKDIAAWLPKVMNDGLICGHDYSKAYPGLQLAVREVFPNPKVHRGTKFKDGKFYPVWSVRL